MSKNITADQGITIGLDLGDKHMQCCCLDALGEVEETFRVRCTGPGLSKRFGGMARCRIVLEVGTHSPWVSRLLSKLGHNAVDAELLARLGRADPKLLSPITHRGQQAQKDLVLLRNHDVSRLLDTSRACTLAK